jgi:DNA invertase Pin-like site-specific DNA recombinase
MRKRTQGGGRVENPASSNSRQAAAYVRMSTEHQQYSTDNQLAAIAQYAQKRGFEITCSYADEGKSGLNLEGRNALKRLLHDIEFGHNDFGHVLVYDVSRWGRFQDPDESATYEMRCRQAGVQVHYCAEQFENDGSPVSNIIKSIKRMMAGEYSRELSVKVHAGQSRLIEKGFRQGGPAGYGLRRVLIDEKGNRKHQLEAGERKSIQTDRVILCPGPKNEVETINWIYIRFVVDGIDEKTIANELNSRSVLRGPGQPWTRGTVHQVLINEKYVGDNVWNRISKKLKGRQVRNEPASWIRANNVFEPLIDRKLFERALAIIDKRSLHLSDDDLLKTLGSLLQKHGYLSGLIIDEAEDCPSSSTYTHRFGGLLRAYTLVGFTPQRDYSYLEINRRLREMHPTIVAETLHQIEAQGAMVMIDRETQLIWVNQEFTVSLLLSRCLTLSSGSRRWIIRFDASLCPDVTLAVRMDPENRCILDYYIFPSIDLSALQIRLGEQNASGLDIYRFDNPLPLFDMSQRLSLRELAS